MPHYPRTYYPNSIPNADDLFAYFSTQLGWKSYPIRMFGKTMMQPRLVAFCADEGVQYQYSQTILRGVGRDPQLAILKNQMNTNYHLGLNSVLCNLYRDGNDSMGRHSDDEKELGPDPIIVSVTLGADRVFKLRHKTSKETISLTLERGSILIMGSGSQVDREHALPKSRKILGPRINLTFRTILY